MRLRFLTRATRQIDAIHDYIAKEDQAAAANVTSAIYSACDRFPEFPAMGRPGLRPGTREWVVPRLPYVVIYAVDAAASEIVILGVFHTRRARTRH